MDTELFLAIALGLACLIGVAVVLRRLGLAANNPKNAYRLGRRTRQAVETVAYKTGQASGILNEVSSVVTGKLLEGRNSVKGTKNTDERGEA